VEVFVIFAEQGGATSNYAKREEIFLCT